MSSCICLSGHPKPTDSGECVPFLLFRRSRFRFSDKGRINKNTISSLCGALAAERTFFGRCSSVSHLKGWSVWNIGSWARTYERSGGQDEGIGGDITHTTRAYWICINNHLLCAGAMLIGWIGYAVRTELCDISTTCHQRRWTNDMLHTRQVFVSCFLLCSEGVDVQRSIRSSGQL